MFTSTKPVTYRQHNHPSTPVEEVEYLYADTLAKLPGNRLRTGLAPLPNWLVALGANWLEAARNQDQANPHLPVPLRPEDTAHAAAQTAVQELCLAFIAAVERPSEHGDYEISPLAQGNGAVVLQLKPGGTIPLLLHPRSVQVLLEMLDRAEEVSQDGLDRDQLRAQFALRRAREAHTEREAR